MKYSVLKPEKVLKEPSDQRILEETQSINSVGKENAFIHFMFGSESIKSSFFITFRKLRKQI